MRNSVAERKKFPAFWIWHSVCDAQNYSHSCVQQHHFVIYLLCSKFCETERQRATRTTKRNKKFHFTFRTPFLSVPFGLKHAINTLHSENKNRGKIVNHTYCDLWLSDFRFVVCDLIWIAYRYILLLFNFLHFL